MELPVEPWRLHDPDVDPEGLRSTATLFTVANGWVGVRGALDELVPTVHAGTLLAPVFEEVPLEYGERAYGFPGRQEQVLAVPDGWAVRLEVDGAPLDVRTGTTHHHTRTLDLRTGVLDRAARWSAPDGATVAVTTSRLASMRRRELVVVRWTVRAETAAHVALRLFPCCDRSPLRSTAEDDPRPRSAVVPDDGSGSRAVDACAHTGAGRGGRAWTTQHVPSSGVQLAVAADVAVVGPGVVTTEDHATTVTADLRAGEEVTLDLLVAFTADRHRAGEASDGGAALVARAHQVLDDARAAGHDALVAEHAAALAEVLDWADVEVDGDPQLQQAVRFAVLQVLGAAALAEGTGIRAKGLTGLGYHGHTFWDADSYVLPVLEHLLPDAARAHLAWRHATLPWAREHARVLGQDGAAFAWRTVSGPEASAYWPASVAARHVDADVADAACRYVAVTGDVAFEREAVVEVVVRTARTWTSLGHHTPDGAFHVHGVTGPDEYTAVVDDNAFTNRMAARNLRAALTLTDRYPEVAVGLGVTDAERDAWRRAADAMTVLVDPLTGVTQQCAGFLSRRVWDFAGTPAHAYPLEDHHTYAELYRRQVVKQADVVAAHWLAGEDVPLEQQRRDLAHYEAITVRDSSLSCPAHAVVAARVGWSGHAHDHLREAALLDLHDLEGDVADGLHVAALAGVWDGLVMGLGGLRTAHPGDAADRAQEHGPDSEALHLAPRLPATLTGLRFGVRHRGARLRVEVEPEKVTYQLLDRLPDGAALTLVHHGERVVLTAQETTAVRVVPPLGAVGAPPSPPPGRELRRPAPRSV
ncbi:glycosyl hydrolase [Actinotalea ferrariae CF5-4]|uniref:Glycosyl hydrolase n=1 Tax=Actinotalea ferrariae CF5-4 TaxID=948458 RepID=A0A021VWZ1_9CELL|nr:glycosyl hydrolase family 65 protein [Actinotalea ferrariae]EYR63592.1 glycosyl hydrolase [Actinotalea ferrariae CF5-4]